MTRPADATTANVWAHELKVAGNLVRQLLVCECALEIVDDASGLQVASEYGRWPALRDAAAAVDAPLTARLPTLARSRTRVTWSGSRDLLDPASVTRSYASAIGFRSPDEPGSLRRPQLGALHSTLGYWTSGLTEPGVIVMPTGTGKTETMLALLVAARLDRLLVIVPTTALRDQIASKFETLGVLQRLGIVASHAMRPVVGRLEHGLADAADAERFAAACNVVVATPPALEACAAEAREAFYPQFSHLMVDEAHHAPATTWARIIEVFQPRPTLLFTATPYREDGKSLPGRPIFRFPLREAQADGYFTHIDYRAVLSLEGVDAALADLTIERLRADRAAGYDHILMARARGITRAAELAKLYVVKAPEFGPRAVHDGLTKKNRDAAFAALGDRSCRIVVCVEMLGEGFDLPQLKIAALHDVKKSLGPMIQFIGRFSRTTADTPIGTASVFVARDPAMALSPLRDLLREDSDWNLLLSDISERATDAVEQLSTFEESFSGAPDGVPVSLLRPKMSAIAHRSPTSSWHPERATTVFGPERLLGNAVATGAEGSVAWFVVEHQAPVGWGDVTDLQETSYELIILYFDSRRRLLYMFGSNKAGCGRAALGHRTQPSQHRSRLPTAPARY